MELDVVGIVFRWMHLLAAITAVGGVLFMRLALVPALKQLDDEASSRLREALRSNWSKMVFGAIFFLLVSGIYNFIMTLKSFDGTAPRFYHMLFGFKFLLALGVFFIGSALAGHSKATQKIRDNTVFYLTINAVLAVTVVCLSGVLRALALH
jgi:uncharacterized membrane protein